MDSGEGHGENTCGIQYVKGIRHIRRIMLTKIPCYVQVLTRGLIGEVNRIIRDGVGKDRNRPLVGMNILSFCDGVDFETLFRFYEKHCSF